MSKYNKTKVSGMFESQYGFTVKVTPEVLAALETVREGGYLNVTRVKDETRQRIAQERRKDVRKTIAAYLEFSEKVAEEAPKASAKVATKGKVERF